jgi:uncharacterized protein YprB with RNaseH-like and TPR domain
MQNEKLIQNVVNPYHLKKSELLLFTTGKCKHSHKYSEHPQCFLTEIMHGGKSPKIGFLDLEFMNFKANYGVLLTYSIKEYHKPNILSSKITTEEVRSKFLDKELTKRLLKDFSKFDVVVTYYGSKCDLPYMRTRALRWKLKFPSYGYVKHIDMYYLVKAKLSLNKNSLQNACALLGIKGKNHVFGDVWLRAVTGHQSSIDYIHDHNVRDVVILEKLYDRMITFSSKTNRSI